MKVEDIINILVKEELLFLTGVPCSYLKDFLAYINTQQNPLQHVIASSEGEAIGIAAGYHLATNKVPIIYLQNSGFGNTVNPLTSLMDQEAYSIPAVLFLTWRGEPGTKDEPQHKKMGRIMLDLLKTLEIPYLFASNKTEETNNSLRELKKIAIKEQKPVALIFRPNLIEKVNYEPTAIGNSLMTREQILETLLPKIGNYPLATTTGKTSREIFELREKFHQPHQFDFLTVGSMGCASGIGLGIALQTKEKVFVIDGDGAVLMKMGTLATIGYHNQAKLIHIIIDNGSYESTGGQPTTSVTLKWQQLLKSVGYKKIVNIKTKQQLKKLTFENNSYPLGVIIYSQPGARKNLGRPTSTPIENKKEFMKFLLK
ncbi:phosphonopyruvate decarboxylase [Candidatus Roizmanbacteria bacterium]|nr:phosphonopyruvate decarboxylase [Candidatus Roizmanbacteria bacterium]